MEQLNSIATATELLARGTCKRSRCYGPRNPFPRVCESPLLRVVFLRVVTRFTRAPPQSEVQFVFQGGGGEGVTLPAHCRLDIVADRIFIHLSSFFPLISVRNFSIIHCPANFISWIVANVSFDRIPIM